MISALSRNWWLAALRGASAVIFGVAALVWPAITFEVLVLLFGAYALVDGVVILTFGLIAVGQGGHLNQISAAAWLPAVLLAYDRQGAPIPTEETADFTWTDEQIQHWLDNATTTVGLGPVPN